MSEIENQSEVKIFFPKNKNANGSSFPWKRIQERDDFIQVVDKNEIFEEIKNEELRNNEKNELSVRECAPRQQPNEP